GRPVLVASDTVTATNAVNRDYAQPVYAALAGPFDQATSGFAGAQSDGLVQLDGAHSLTSSFADAGTGNVVQTARVETRKAKPFVIALGFGATQGEAVGVAEGSLATDFDRLARGYEQGWDQYDRSLVEPPK